MACRMSLVLALIVLLTDPGAAQESSAASEYFVATTGDDANDGSSASTPFLTLQKCVDTIGQSTGQCTMLGGRYRDPVSFDMKRKGAITIAAYDPSNPPVIDGTEELSLEWTKDSSFSGGCVYRSAPVTGTVPWFLWIDEVPLTPARWPNAKLSDYSVFDKTNAAGEGPLAFTSQESSLPAMGEDLTLYDDGTHSPSLKESGIDFTDTLVVQSFGSMMAQTTGCRVKSYNPDEGSLIYSLPTDFDWVSSSANGHPNLPYFFEGHPKLLDAEEEWSYDATANTLLVWMPSCMDPNAATIRGRVRDVSLTMSRADVTLSGIRLFGTTFSAEKTTLNFYGVTFDFPTWNKRAIGDQTETVHTETGGTTTLTMKDSSVLYCDGPQFLTKIGSHAVFSNNLFKATCYGTGTSATVTSNGYMPQYLTFDRNTVTHYHCMSGVLPHNFAQVSNNYFVKQGVYLDGAAIHIQGLVGNGVVVHNNWIGDHVIKSIRVDRINTVEAVWGENVTITNNVAWDTSSLFVKGDKHTVNNNVVFASTAAADGSIGVVFEGTRTWAKPGENEYTVIENNIADSFLNESGVMPPLAKNNIGNLNGEWWRDEMKDPYNMDFRPKQGSESCVASVGAYGCSLSDEEYATLIPGSTLLKPTIIETSAPTTAAPNAPPTLTPTLAPTTTTCQALCYTSNAAWETRCGWGKCKGCSECSSTSAPTASVPASSGATEAPTLTPTLAPTTATCQGFCASNNQLWGTKCGWGKCKGCAECSEALAQFAADNTDSWEESDEFLERVLK